MSRNHKSYDCFFAKCLTCFDPVEPLHQHVTITIGTNENGRLLADFENALCNLAHDIRVDAFTGTYIWAIGKVSRFILPTHSSAPANALHSDRTKAKTNEAGCGPVSKAKQRRSERASARRSKRF